MKKRYIFSLAAMALLTAACSSDEMALNLADQPAPVEQKIPFTAVISGDAAGTRALTEASDGKTITAKWEKEEKVALIHGETIDVLEVTNVDATTGAATISGTITNPKNEETVYVVYVGHQHVNMSNYVSSLQELYTNWKTDNPEESAIPTAIISEPVNKLLATQDGTLETISNKHDYRFASSTFAVSDGKATFASEVKMPAKYAIWKLNLTTDGTTALKANKLVMKKDGEAKVTIEGTETSSEFYIAFIPSVQANAYTFSATTSDDKTYTCTPTVSALDGGKYYRSTLTMAAAATGNTYRVYTSGTAYTDEAIPSDAVTVTSTTTTWAAGTYLVSDEVTIASDVTLSGDVDLILKDGAELKVNGCIFGGADYENGFVYKLNIFGQSSGTGKLTVDYSGTHTLGVVTASELNIHGGVITVGGTGVWQGLEPNVFNVYHGTINASAGMTAIQPMGNAHIYGGDITAHSTTTTYGGSSAFLLPNGGTTLTISGGSVTAISDEAAGLETVYNLVITGGTVEATGNGGNAGIYVKGNLNISGGTVTATGNGGGEGILCNYTAESTITIDGGTVISTANGNAGVGLEGSNIIINDGDVTATGGNAIEGNNSSGGAGIDGTLTVNGGTVTATSGAKDGTAESDSPGISELSTVTLGTGIKFYEGDAANSMSEASVSDRSKRYSKIE